MVKAAHPDWAKVTLDDLAFPESTLSHCTLGNLVCAENGDIALDQLQAVLVRPGPNAGVPIVLEQAENRGALAIVVANGLGPIEGAYPQVSISGIVRMGKHPDEFALGPLIANPAFDR
jgi:hypothetical protein